MVFIHETTDETCCQCNDWNIGYWPEHIKTKIFIEYFTLPLLDFVMKQYRFWVKILIKIPFCSLYRMLRHKNKNIQGYKNILPQNYAFDLSNTRASSCMCGGSRIIKNSKFKIPNQSQMNQSISNQSTNILK